MPWSSDNIPKLIILPVREVTESLIKILRLLRLHTELCDPSFGLELVLAHEVDAEGNESQNLTAVEGLHGFRFRLLNRKRGKEGERGHAPDGRKSPCGSAEHHWIGKLGGLINTENDYVSRHGSIEPQGNRAYQSCSRCTRRRRSARW